MDDNHLVAAFRYVALNPVKAGVVAQAQDWRWSSAAAHTAGTAIMPLRRFGHGDGADNPMLRLEGIKAKIRTRLAALAGPLPFAGSA